jgi:hypothetical protein
MDFENERQLVTQDFIAFMAQQAAILPAPPVNFNNIAFSQPDNGPWIRFNLVPVVTVPASIGAKMTRTNGVMAIQIFSPGLGGTKMNRQLADAIANYFNFRNLEVARGWLHYQTCTAEDYGHNDGFYQMNANVPFWRDTRLDA